VFIRSIYLTIILPIFIFFITLHVRSFQLAPTLILLILAIAVLIAILIKYRLILENRCLEKLSIDQPALQTIQSSLLWIEQEQNYQIRIPFKYTADFSLHALRFFLHTHTGFKPLAVLSIPKSSTGLIEISICETQIQKGMIYQIVIESSGFLGLPRKYKSFRLMIPFYIIPKQPILPKLNPNLLLSETRPLEKKSIQKKVPQSIKQGHDEFKELRDYQQGDSLSKIAWSLLAKRQKLIVKTYEHAFDLKAMVLIELSTQMKHAVFDDSPLDLAIQEAWYQSKFLYQNDRFSEVYLGAFSHDCFKVDLMRKQNAFLQALIHLKSRYEQAFLPLESSYLQDQVTLFLYTTQQIKINMDDLKNQSNLSSPPLQTILSKEDLIEACIQQGWIKPSEITEMQNLEIWENRLREICVQYCIPLVNAWTFDLENENQRLATQLIQTINWNIKRGINVMLILVYLPHLTEDLLTKLREAKRKGLHIIWVQMLTIFNGEQRKAKIEKHQKDMQNVCEYYEIRLF
jgi:hypothetical protein